MLYLTSSVTMPLSIASVLLILCIGEAVAIFYLLGSKKKSLSATEETSPARALSPGEDNADEAASEEDLAVILSVLCEELNARPEELIFKDVKAVS